MRRRSLMTWMLAGGVLRCATARRRLKPLHSGKIAGSASRSILPCRCRGRARRRLAESLPCPFAPPLPVSRSNLPCARRCPPAATLPSGPAGAGFRETAAPSPDAVDCPSRLEAAKVAVEKTAVGPQPDPQCTVVDAVHLSALTMADGAVVTFPDKPTLSCATASTFSAFVRDLLSPLAKGTYGSAVDTVWTGPGLDCQDPRPYPRGQAQRPWPGPRGRRRAVQAEGRSRKIEVGRPASEDRSRFRNRRPSGRMRLLPYRPRPWSRCFP